MIYSFICKEKGGKAGLIRICKGCQTPGIERKREGEREGGEGGRERGRARGRARERERRSQRSFGVIFRK